MCDAFYDIEDFKKDLREACAKLKALHGICEAALLHVEDLEEFSYKKWAEDEVLQDLIQSSFNEVRASYCRRIYASFAALNRFYFRSNALGSINPGNKDAKQNYDEIHANSGEFYAFTDGNSIYVKTPMIPSIWVKRNTLKKYGSPAFIYTEFLKFAVRDTLSAIAEQLPTLGEKTINYLFVYNDRSNNIADADNHDCKSVTDSICMFTLGGDTGMTTDFVYATTVVPAEELPEGTYIAVVPERKHYLGEAEILSAFQKQFRTNQNTPSKFQGSV